MKRYIKTYEQFVNEGAQDKDVKAWIAKMVKEIKSYSKLAMKYFKNAKTEDDLDFLLNITSPFDSEIGGDLWDQEEGEEQGMSPEKIVKEDSETLKESFDYGIEETIEYFQSFTDLDEIEDYDLSDDEEYQAEAYYLSKEAFREEHANELKKIEK